MVPPKSLEDCVIQTSPGFLSSILDNLIKNSVEAMPNGGEIAIDWVFDSEAAVLLVEVSDSGPGVLPEMLTRLLAGESVESSKRTGSGLGMLTVRAMLEKIGGRLDGVSVSGKGTRWSLSIPSLQQTDEGAELSEIPPSSTPVDSSSLQAEVLNA
jgi:signal transduction histidine kinase